MDCGYHEPLTQFFDNIVQVFSSMYHTDTETMADNERIQGQNTLLFKLGYLREVRKPLDQARSRLLSLG
jgi:hypothetical protein